MAPVFLIKRVVELVLFIHEWSPGSSSCAMVIIQSRSFDFLSLTFLFYVFSSLKKGEGGEERQQRQCSMEEEITQETGGKRRCVSVSPSMWMRSVSTLLCVHAYVVFTCACVCV